jgi:hypothetical protein
MKGHVRSAASLILVCLGLSAAAYTGEELSRPSAPAAPAPESNRSMPPLSEPVSLVLLASALALGGRQLRRPPVESEPRGLAPRAEVCATAD